MTKRGVVLRAGQTLSDLYKERTVLYEKYANITIDCEGKIFERLSVKLRQLRIKSKKFHILLLLNCKKGGIRTWIISMLFGLAD